MTDKRIPASEIRRVWLDPALTTKEAADQLCVARSTVWKRAKGQDLPKRKTGRRMMIQNGDRDFAQMWIAGVLSNDIAVFYHCHPAIVAKSAMRMGLAKRTLGRRPSLTMAQYQESVLAAQMTAQAQKEQEHLIDAEMVDGKRRRVA